MIVTRGLTRHFNGKVAVENLSLQVRDGEVFGFIGPNGAGKTTTVRMLCALIEPTAGEAFIDDNRLGGEADDQRIREMVGLLPEVPGLHDSLTATQLLDFYGRLHQLGPERRRGKIKELLGMMGLWESREERLVTFSKGMKQKIAIARALIHEPRYLFLDEPTAALDPVAAKTVRDLILDLKDRGSTIFITTHNLAEAERICDTVAIFNRTLVDVGSPGELARKYFNRRMLVTLGEVPVSGATVTPSGRGSLPGVVEGIRGVTRAELKGRLLVVDTVSPSRTNPEMIKRLVGEGVAIEYVTEKDYSLEDVYLKVMGTSIDQEHKGEGTDAPVAGPDAPPPPASRPGTGGPGGEVGP